MFRYFFIALLSCFTLQCCFVQAQDSTYIAELDTLIAKYLQAIPVSPPKAKTYINELLELSLSYDQPLYAAKAYYALGNLAFKKGAYDTSVFQVKKALKVLNAEKIESGKSACYNLLGLSYKNIGNLSAAMKSFAKCLELAQESKDRQHEGNAYQNIGMIYYQQKNYDKTLENLKLAEAIYKEIDDKDGIMTTHFNYGNVNKELGQYNTARSYYREVLSYYEKEGNLVQQAYIHMSMSQMLLQEKRYSKAYVRLLETKNRLTNLGFKADLAMVLNDLGVCLRGLNRDKEALYYFHQALKEAEESSNLYFKSNIYNNMALLYENNHQYKEALRYFRKERDVKEESNSAEREKYVAQLQEQYESQLKESQIALLEKESKLQEAKLQRADINAQKQSVIRNFLIAGFVLVVFALVISRYLYLQNIKAQHELSLQQQENARRKNQEMIKDFKLKAIERYQEGQNQERARISRELHDGIGNDLASLKMLIENYIGDRNATPQTQRMLSGLQNVYKDLRNIAHSLRPPEFFKTGFCEFLADFLNQSQQSSHLTIKSFFFPEASIDTLDEGLLVDVYRIIQELIANTIKHANAELAEVQITHHGDYLNIVVSDNGKGLVADKKKKGIGLQNIKDRLLILNGDMEIDSSPQGTIVNITIQLPGQMKQPQV